MGNFSSSFSKEIQVSSSKIIVTFLWTMMQGFNNALKLQHKLQKLYHALFDHHNTSSDEIKVAATVRYELKM